MKQLTESDLLECVLAYKKSCGSPPASVRIAPSTILRLSREVGVRGEIGGVPIIPDPRCPPEICYATGRPSTAIAVGNERCMACGASALGNSPTGGWCNACGWASPGVDCVTCGRRGVNSDHLSPTGAVCFQPHHYAPKPDDRRIARLSVGSPPARLLRELHANDRAPLHPSWDPSHREIL